MEQFTIFNLILAGILTFAGFYQTIKHQYYSSNKSKTWKLNPSYHIHYWQDSVVKLETRKLNDEELCAFFNRDFATVERDIIMEIEYRNNRRYYPYYDEPTFTRSFTSKVLVEKIRKLQKDGLL